MSADRKNSGSMENDHSLDPDHPTNPRLQIAPAVR
jgi:hypothetical protein